MEDAKIVELYWDRNERAIVETETKYGKLCKLIAKNIVGCMEDVEEVLSEAYLGVWNSIPPNRPKYLKTFVCKITKNRALAKARYNSAEKRNTDGVVSLDELSDIVSGQDDVEKTYEKKVVAGYISDFLRSIEEEKKNIFLSRYWYHNSMSDIAKTYGISESKVKTTLFRIRRKLKDYLKEQGVEL